MGMARTREAVASFRSAKNRVRGKSGCIAVSPIRTKPLRDANLDLDAKPGRQAAGKGERCLLPGEARITIPKHYDLIDACWRIPLGKHPSVERSPHRNTEPGRSRKGCLDTLRYAKHLTMNGE